MDTNIIKKRIPSHLENIPKFTISIPAYQKVDLLKDAVHSCLSQTCRDFELLIIDDCAEGNDIFDFLQELHDPRICYYQNMHNTGMVDNWNRCFSMARTEWVVLLHDDDLLYPDSLEKYDQLIRLNPKTDCFFAMGQRVRLGNDVSYVRHSDTATVQKLRNIDMLLGNITGTCCGSCFNRKRVLEIGGFDNKYYPTHDYAFGIKAVKNAKCIRISNYPLVVGRIGENTTMKPGVLENILKQDLILRRNICSQYNTVFKRLFNYITDYTHAMLANGLSMDFDPHFDTTAYLKNQSIDSKRNVLWGVKKLASAIVCRIIKYTSKIAKQKIETNNG